MSSRIAAVNTADHGYERTLNRQDKEKPYYSYYEYDGPIYSYDGLPPDQVIANVQGALQRLGYYRYAVDGVLGPLTQAALANYQRDYGLPSNGGIDPETLRSLGFIA